QHVIPRHESELLLDFALTVSDTLDSMEHTGELLVISEVGAVPTPLLEAAKGVERAAELTVAVTWKLSRVRDLGDHYEQVRKLQRQGDRLVRRARGELYPRGGPAQELLPLRDAAESVRATITLQERSARIADLLRVKDS